MILYAYLVIAAALVPISDRFFFPVFKAAYSWWAVPVLLLGYLFGLILLHAAVVVLSIAVLKLDRNVEKHNRYYRFLTDLTLPMIFKLARVHIHLSGEELLPQEERFLLVANHVHDFDPAVIIAALPDAELGFIGKKEIRTIYPFVAKLMQKLRCLFIDRENNREGAKTIIEAANLLKNDVVSVGLFPEGYCSKDGAVQPMRNGSFKIAYKAKVPIVVCTLVNSEKIVKNMFRRPTEVYLDVLKVYSAADLESLSTVELGEEVYATMKENVARRRAKNEK